MKTRNYQRKSKLLFRLLVGIFALLCFLLPFGSFAKGEGAVSASAESAPTLAVKSYNVDMTVLPSRKVEVREKIYVEFLTDDTTMFFRSLPTDGTKYANFKAACPGNAEFHYDVVNNPDTAGFIDVECIGGVSKGARWEYEISYTMIPQMGILNTSLHIDVIGFGWAVPLYNVSFSVHFPVALQREDVVVYLGEYGSSETTQEYSFYNENKTLSFSCQELPLADNDMAKGVSVQFTVPEGVFEDWLPNRLWTEDMWKLLVSTIIFIVFALFIFLIRPRRDIVTVVNIKPPDGMTPIEMGKLIDGNINNEDVTSMIYYFAHKGWLKINFEDEDDPTLTCLVADVPDDTPAHVKTLYYGLFPKLAPNSIKEGVKERSVKVSEVALKFFEASQRAKLQVPSVKPMYDKRSVFCFLTGGILGILYALFSGLAMGSKLGGGYLYFGGIFLFIPVVTTLVLSWVRENYRYKWKKGKRNLFFFISLSVMLTVSFLFVAFFADHLMTGWEKGMVCLGSLLPVLITQGALVRSERYIHTLDDVLGFREFILVTEEDKIAFMLQENPELYYDVLPYAQVLGVTDEWEKKFERLTVAPPTWYEGRGLTTFDYVIINRCLTRSMLQGMAAAVQKTGSKVGTSGGGRSFGGFGGGGFGGGGGGAR